MEERLEKERLEKQREIEERLAKGKLEQEERFEVEKEKMQYSLKMIELEISSIFMPPVSFDPSKVFDITKHIRLVPPFQEKEVGKYFLRR